MDALGSMRGERRFMSQDRWTGSASAGSGIGGDGVVAPIPPTRSAMSLWLDDYDDLYAMTPLGDRISLSSRGPEYGHLMQCRRLIHGQRQSLLQNVTARIQLRLADPGESQMGHLSNRGAADVETAQDLVDGKACTSCESVFRPAPVPARAGGHHRCRGADRRRGRGDRARSSQRLSPQRVELSAIVEHEAVHLRAVTICRSPFAIGSATSWVRCRSSARAQVDDLRPARLRQDRAGGHRRAVMNRFSPQQAQLTLIDPKQLRTARSHPGYVCLRPQDEIDEVITELAQQIFAAAVAAQGFGAQEELVRTRRGRTAALCAHRRRRTAAGSLPTEAAGGWRCGS